MSLNTLVRYTLGGVVFGLSFPIFSQLIDCFLQDLTYNWSNIVWIHQQNVTHYVVDSAPLVLGLAGFLLGLSDQKKNDINTKLLIINQSLDTLTYKITHDLRGPALNIKGLVEILKVTHEELSPNKQREILDKLDSSVSVWLQTFEDFMTLLRQEKSGNKEKTICILADIVSDIKKELENELEESRTTLQTHFSGCPSVYAAHDDMHSVFKNLISNAIKYAHRDRDPEIKIEAKTLRNQAELTISDNGSGIDLELYGDRIFKIFERMNAGSNVPGSGIGLYLVKEQIEKNDGRIKIDSIPDEGTIFTIHLPILP